MSVAVAIKNSNRHYNPEIGRFISADPLYVEEMDKRGVDTQKLNVYSYVNNNPINMIDPTGMLGFKFTVSFGAEFGLGRSYSTGIAVAWDENGKMSLGVVENGKDSTIGLQAGVGGDLIKIGINNTEHVKDMEGLSGGGSGIVGEFKYGLGGTIGYEQGTNAQGKEIKEFSFGVTYGIGAGIGKLSASENEIGIIKDETLKTEPMYQHQSNQEGQNNQNDRGLIDLNNSN